MEIMGDECNNNNKGFMMFDQTSLLVMGIAIQEYISMMLNPFADEKKKNYPN